MFKRHVIKELSSYLDNQLAEKEKLKVEAHLKDCEFCQKELSRLRLLSDKLKTWQVSEPGPFFAAGVKDEIAREGLERGARKMKTKKWYIVVPSSVLVGILVLAFMGSYFGRSMTGRLRASADVIGKQYNPDNGWQTAWETQGAGSTVTREGRNVATGAASISIAKLGREKTVTALGGGFTGYDADYDEPYYINKGQHKMNDLKDRAGRGVDDEWGGRRELARNAVLGSGAIMTGELGTEYAQAQPQIPSPEGAPVIIIQPTLPATGIGDKIIRTAEVQLEVEDAGQAYKKVSTICQELGGYLAASNFHKDREGRQTGTITMRIPKDKFLDALNKINALGKVENSSTQSQDVSQEYANLKNQLETTMIIYNKMMEALQKRQVTIPEAMRLESELSPILRRVESLKNKIDYLNNAISFTTITVYFREPEVSLKALKDSKQGIKESMLAASIGAVKFLAKAIPVTIAVVIWLAIILAIAVVLKNWVVRLFKRQ
jgi:hypothetical protein